MLYLYSQKKNGWELKPDEIAGLMLKLQNESNCHNINFGENNLKIRYWGKVLRSYCNITKFESNDSNQELKEISFAILTELNLLFDIYKFLIHAVLGIYKNIAFHSFQ